MPKQSEIVTALIRGAIAIAAWVGIVWIAHPDSEALAFSRISGRWKN